MSGIASDRARRYGPWAVVTGASDGIGRAFAQQLAADGLNLVLVARRQPQLQALAAELQRTHGVQCRVVAADLSDLEAVHRLTESTADLDVGLLVARVTLAALGRQTTVRPGWLSKLLGWSLALLPRWGQVMVIAQVMKGMTARPPAPAAPPPAH